MTKCCFLFLPFVLIRTILIILINLPHPVHAITLTLLYRIILRVRIAAWKTNYIAPIIFSIIIIRGLIIIFIYFSRLVSNVKHNLKKTPTLIILTINLIIILTTPTHYRPLTQVPDLIHLNLKNHTIDPIIAIYFPPLQPLTIIRITYLLITIMAIVKTCSPQAKSIRTKSLKAKN